MIRFACLVIALAACDGRSASMQLASTVVSSQREPSRNPAELRADYAKRTYPIAEKIPDALLQRVDVREEDIDGNDVYTLTPKEKRSHWHLVYTHGGSFVHGIVGAHWDIIGELITATGATVTVPDYPLAPEHPHPAAHTFLETLYRQLVDQVGAQNLVLIGDSAGGNLALIETLRARDAKLPLPARVILFSPWVDLTMHNPTLRKIQLRDPMLRWYEMAEYGRWWAGEKDRADPWVSPINADLKRLPPVDIYQGTDDILYPDAKLLSEHIKAAGGTVNFHETRGAFHDFMGVTFAPEAKAVYRQIGKDLAR